MASQTSSGPNWTWLRRSIPHLLVALILAFSLLTPVHAQQFYFIIDQPGASSSIANGSPYPFKWTKGLLDGVETFDVELTRLNQDGLWLVAQNVPSTYKSLNILLQDIPEGDNYFLLAINSTHGVVYGVSSRFSVTNASHSNPSPAADVPTVTISGTPNPLKQFAATLGPAAANGAGSLVLGDRLSPNARVLGFGGILILCAVLLGAAMTL